MPQAHGADDRAVALDDEGQALGRQRPSRRRSQVFWNRAAPKQASSSASRASTSRKVSSRIVIMAVASQYVG